RWSLPATGAGLLLFLLLPRPTSDDMWNPLAGYAAGERGPNKVSAETGLDTEIDMTRTGTVKTKDELALVVIATDPSGTPKLDLAPAQRSRGHMFDFYLYGHWSSPYVLSSPMMMPQMPGGGALPPGTRPAERPPGRTEAPAIYAPSTTAPVVKLC